MPISTSIDAIMQRYSGGHPGAALLVIQDGVTCIANGYGLADLESAIPVSPSTNFRLASISKQFTAACILLLAEDGLLTLDDPIKRWLPTLPDAADAVLIHHLLSHTSGLIDYEDVMDADQVEQLRDLDVLHLLESQEKLYFAPGSEYRYSNGGYALLALIVGRAAQTNYASFIKQRIFEPLGMLHSLALEAGYSEINHRAYGYSEQDGHWQRTDQDSTSAVLGDGGIYANIEDLARWDAALYDERLLKASSLQLAFSPATATQEPYVPFYGYGWRINGDLLWHSGESIGFRNVMLRYPKQRLTVILLSNRNAPEPFPIARQIASHFGAA